MLASEKRGVISSPLPNLLAPSSIGFASNWNPWSWPCALVIHILGAQVHPNREHASLSTELLGDSNWVMCPNTNHYDSQLQHLDPEVWAKGGGNSFGCPLTNSCCFKVKPIILIRDWISGCRITSSLDFHPGIQPIFSRECLQSILMPSCTSSIILPTAQDVGQVDLPAVEGSMLPVTSSFTPAPFSLLPLFTHHSFWSWCFQQQ